MLAARLFLAFGLAVLATRLLLLEQQLFSFDDVNLTYAVDELDIRKGQPQPPGYPLFVAEMRLARLLRIKRPESVLHALAIGGSIATLVLLALTARPIVRARAAVFAAILLLAHPVFWYAALTSALRIQLALFSTLIGVTCWRAFTDGGRWPMAASLALAVGAGVRPELGVVFLPLWAWSVRRDWLRCSAVLAGTVLAWLIPLVWASGGPVDYWRHTIAYLADQSSVSNAMFGAGDRINQRTLTWLAVWVFGPVPAWLPALAIQRPGRQSGDLRMLLFLGAWLLLPFAFSAMVHVADPGQTLAALPPLCLLGGLCFQAAEERLRPASPAAAAYAAMAGIALIPAATVLREAIPFLRTSGHPRELFVLLPASMLAGALAVRWIPWQRMLPGLLLTPAVLLSAIIFFYPGWYHRGTGPLDRHLEDLHSGLNATTYPQIRQTVHNDHRAIEQIRAFERSRPGQTLILWQEGAVSWRKLSYYLPRTPIAVLGRVALRPDAPPQIDYWMRSNRIPAVVPAPGWLLIWVTKDSPAVRIEEVQTSPGSAVRGPYRISW